ncbi:hypothetical protein M2271_003608 [Streptomyces sp. LBL]|nr:hypothetical protein [Streptomyces sp. LBL]MDH6625797.1 hypothetical protein [Streptomyces sp. LBL]
MASPEPEALPAVGTVMVDTIRGVTGEFRDALGGTFFLRPVGGGREWPVRQEHVRQATDAERLAAKVGVANARSRNGIQ